MAEESSWLDKIIAGTTTITASYFAGRAAQETAKAQSVVNQNQVDANKQAQVGSNMTRNILLIVGGTLGALLVYQTARRILK